MTENLHLVFSNPPSAIGAEQYNEWYDFHITEILAVPGFSAARRYSITTNTGTRAPAGYRFLSLYEIDGGVEEVRQSLSGSRTTSRMQLPEWFSGIQFASWTGLLRESYETPQLADNLQFVFSSVPEEVSDADYDTWARQHMERSRATSGADGSWRFRCVAANAGAKSAAETTDLAMYAVPATDLHRWEPLADPSGAPCSPGRLDVASLPAVAVGDRVSN
jgi:hypothetical protein